jgi:hypothetical protein
MENLKMDESLNLNSEIRNVRLDYAKVPQSNLRFRISDLRFKDSSIFKFLRSIFLIVGLLPAQQGKSTFIGTITDNMCPEADHSRMRMGSTDAECTIACISAHGATYVLYDGKDVYALSDQQTPEKFAGKKVTVRGTLDAKTKTIQVDSITLSTSESKSQ